MKLKRFLAATCLAAVVLAPGSAQEKKEVVPRSVSSDLLEKVLTDLNIRYEKTVGKTPNSYLYNFERNNFKIRLTNYGGKLLWLAAAFPRATPEQINAWNVRAKFSRAVLLRAGGQETSQVESQLDCAGGVTEGIVGQFFRRFDNEVRDFKSSLNR